MFGNEYRCDRCGAEACAITARLLRYRLDDGAVVTWCDRPAWCNDCKTIRPSEWLPEAEALAASLRDVETSGLNENEKSLAKWAGVDEDTALQEKLQDRRAALRWRLARRSPPRCLECGSMSIEPLFANPSSDHDYIEHPGCGGHFRVVRSWHGSQASYRILTAEGLPWTEDAATA
jgi:hypothetical protein